MDVITRRPFKSIVCNHYVHLVVAVWGEASNNSRGFSISVGKCLRLHRPVDSQPPQLTAVPPVVNLSAEQIKVLQSLEAEHSPKYVDSDRFLFINIQMISNQYPLSITEYTIIHTLYSFSSPIMELRDTGSQCTVT